MIQETRKTFLLHTMAIPGPKVFIAYAHNPEPYDILEQPDIETAILHNPGLSVQELQRLFDQECYEHQISRDTKISEHMKLVYLFANFLRSSGVNVEFDQDLNDVGCDNYLKWCLDKIEASQHVILIVTPSLKDFLRSKAPDEEWLFVGDSLYNLIEGNSKPFLPVFLNIPKDNDLLPVSLHNSSRYEVWGDFTLKNERTDNLVDLYARLIGEDRFNIPRPPVSIVQIPKKKSRGKAYLSAIIIACIAIYMWQLF